MVHGCKLSYLVFISKEFSYDAAHQKGILSSPCPQLLPLSQDHHLQILLFIVTSIFELSHLLAQEYTVVPSSTYITQQTPWHIIQTLWDCSSYSSLQPYQDFSGPPLHTPLHQSRQALLLSSPQHVNQKLDSSIILSFSN